MKFFINNQYFNKVKYVLRIIENYSKVSFDIVPDKSTADIVIDHKDENSIPISNKFYDNLDSNNFNHNIIFPKEPIIKDETDRPDYISSIFYIINSLQEYKSDPEDEDELGRFLYEKSWQKKYNVIERNLVLEYIFEFLNFIKVEKKNDFNSKIFVSHDIDKMNGSFLQDGFWALKKGRFDIVLSLIFKEIFNKKDWVNIDKILKIESEYDIKSTFFWLVNKGIGKDNIKNADYSIKRYSALLENIENKGAYNGLHKSCSDQSIDEELSLLPKATTYNRHHYLNFKLPALYDDIENSKINFDSGLGFVEHYGFRNSFAMPFHPFNLQEDKPYSFVEMPLMMMDGTFQEFMLLPVSTSADTAIAFFEKHKTNSYLSLLWHNTFFTNYKYGGYREEFIKIIKYLYDTNFEFVTPEDLMKAALPKSIN